MIVDSPYPFPNFTDHITVKVVLFLSPEVDPFGFLAFNLFELCDKIWYMNDDLNDPFTMVVYQL